MTGAAATVVSRGTLFGVFALVLGAVAGWFSGTTGTVAPTIADRNVGRRSCREIAGGAEDITEAAIVDALSLAEAAADAAASI
jgi:hypothetical protein